MNKLLAIIILIFAQVSFAQNNAAFNYIDVNHAALTVSTAQTGGNYFNAYNLSVLDMSHQLADIFKKGEVNKEYYLNKLIKVTKVFYTKDNSRMLIIQPVYEDASKRCILLTNGNGENFNWSMSNRTAIDYALRGYVVAYYENVGSVAGRFDGKGNTVNYYTAKVINQVGAITAKDKFFASMYVNLFLTNAARKFMADNSAKVGIDTTKFYLSGGSLGANASLFFTYADGNNFTHPLFNAVKNKLGFNQPINNNGIVAVAAFGGGLPGPAEGLGTIIDQQDKTPAFFFSGSLDWVVNPNKTTILGPENWGPLALRSMFDANNIPYNTYINAYGTHVFQTPSFNQQWSSLPAIQTAGTANEKVVSGNVDAYAKKNMINLLMYQYENTQMHEAGKMAASYFDQAANNSTPKSAVTFVEPKCIQNTIFYQYSIGKLSIENAAKYFTTSPNNPEINKSLDKITSTCLDGTFQLYSKGATAPIVPDNFMAPGKGLRKLANFLEILNQLNKKK